MFTLRSPSHSVNYTGYLTCVLCHQQREDLVNIQLIQPPRNPGYVANSRSACYPPLGLISIATYCRSVFPQATIEVLDGEFLTLEEILGRLKPGAILGIETKMLNYSSALVIAEAGKARQCVVVFGGVYASAIPEVIMRKRANLVDHLVVGYGEKEFAAIVRHHTQGAHSTVVLPRVIRHSIPDFNDIPLPDRSAFVHLPTYVENFRAQHPGWAQWNVTNAITQQGCQHKCVFCERQTPGIGNIYYRNPESIWQEVQLLHDRHGVDYLVVFDDQIAQNVKWLACLVQSKPAGISVRWHVFSTAENITEESLELLAQLPTQHVFVGVETGDAELAKRVGKGRAFSPELCLQTMCRLAQVGIGVTPSFILGLPGETEATLATTLAHAHKIQELTGFAEVFAACLIPFPGTIAFRQLAARCPELRDEDVFDGEELTRMWFTHFCAVDYETARNRVEQILALGKYPITLDKGGHVI